MSPSSSNNVILSLHNEYYKQTMWSHYRLLGETNNADTERHMANTIIGIFQAKLAKTNGKFYKQAGCGNSLKNLEVVDEKMALGKIIADIQRRMKNYDAWSVVGGETTASDIHDDRHAITNTHQCQSKTDENNVILSLHNDYYKKIMWSHYRKLGKTRDSDREMQVGQAVLDIMKDKLSKNHGKFYRQVGCGNSCTNLEEVDEEIALAKIITHIQRRMKNYDAWSQCDDDVTSMVLNDNLASTIETTNSVSVDATPATSGSSTGDKEILSQFFDETDNNVILSLHNDYYKRIMWSHFKILGKDRDLDTEKLIGETIFDIFKNKISSSTCSSGITIRRGRRCGKFYKLDKTCTSMEEVNDDVALAKIIADIQRRMRNYATWCVEEDVIDGTTTSGSDCASASCDADDLVKNASEWRNAEKATNLAVVYKNSIPIHSPLTITENGTTEQMIDTTATLQQDFSAQHCTSFKECLKGALDSYHKNHTLLKNYNNPPPPIPPPFLSHEEECTIKTALAFVMARARIKSRMKKSDFLSRTPVMDSTDSTGAGVDEGIIDSRSGRFSPLPPQGRVCSETSSGSSSNFNASNHNFELERKLKHVRDVLKLAVSAVLPFYKDTLKENECVICCQDGVVSVSSKDDDATTLEPISGSRVDKRPCAVYDYEAAVESSNTVNSGVYHQYASLDGLCQHILARLFSIIRDESLRSRAGREVFLNSDRECATNNKSSTISEAPTIATSQSRGNISNVHLRDQRSGKKPGNNFISNAIVKLIYNDLIGDAHLHQVPSTSIDVRECAERRIEKIMAVCHILHRLLYLDNGCCLGTECVTAICFTLSDLYMNRYSGMTHVRDDGIEQPNESILSVANAEISCKNSSDGERYQVVSSRWCNSSSVSYINQRHNRRRQSGNALFQRLVHSSKRKYDNCTEVISKEEHPLPSIGDVLAVNMLRLLEGAAAIRIHHRQRRVPSSRPSRYHRRELIIDSVVQETATDVLNEIRSSIDHELLLPLHVEDAARFCYLDSLRSAKIIRESRGRRKTAGDTSMVLLQSGAKIMMRLHLFDLTNKLALCEQA